MVSNKQVIESDRGGVSGVSLSACPAGDGGGNYLASESHTWPGCRSGDGTPTRRLIVHCSHMFALNQIAEIIQNSNASTDKLSKT